MGERACKQTELLVHIKQIFQKSKCRYGSPRIAAELTVQGIFSRFLITADLLNKQYGPYESSLLSKPFIAFNEEIICLIPATVSKSLCDYIKTVSEDLNQNKALSIAFHNWQNSKI